MKFVSLRDFRTRTPQIRKDLNAEHEIVLTASGRPIAILAQVDEDNFEDRLKALRQARAHALLDRIQAKAKATGVDKLTTKQIDAVIVKSRRERRGGK